MPAKRPVPLTDAALGHKSEATGELTNQSAIGETNAGVPLPVKNTFIDVPSGFSPTTTPTDAQPVSTAPAQVHFQQGFLKRAVLESVEESSAAPSNGPSQGASAKGPPSVRSNFEARQKALEEQVVVLTKQVQFTQERTDQAFVYVHGEVKDIKQSVKGIKRQLEEQDRRLKEVVEEKARRLSLASTTCSIDVD
mmetsp:Transcript_4025/g.9661  ORF Transcript_4025/g.9661 Transcript_4025/m.9661 type:complete len:194 (-) Transcript_4025:59-640(-)